MHRIYRIGKPEIEEDDNIFTTEYKLTKIGTDLIIQLLKKIEAGQKLNGVKQDLSKGKFYLWKDFLPSNARVVMDKIENGILRKYVREQNI